MGSGRRLRPQNARACYPVPGVRAGGDFGFSDLIPAPGLAAEDIACWFIDTTDNDEAFFVRHAYCTGAGDPYERLRKTLRAEIDEAAWASLYRTTSRPFPPPTTGKIAVKVINHYGDEVLKVYSVSGG